MILAALLPLRWKHLKGSMWQIISIFVSEVYRSRRKSDKIVFVSDDIIIQNVGNLFSCLEGWTLSLCILHFLCSLLNNAVLNSDCIASNVEWLEDRELERMWKKTVWTLFVVPSRHVPGETEDNRQKPQDCWCSGRDSNRAPSEY
jgi:hypothetical protein